MPAPRGAASTTDGASASAPSPASGEFWPFYAPRLLGGAILGALGGFCWAGLGLSFAGHAGPYSGGEAFGIAFALAGFGLLTAAEVYFETAAEHAGEPSAARWWRVRPRMLKAQLVTVGLGGGLCALGLWLLGPA